jgi:hypothetical protein
MGTDELDDLLNRFDDRNKKRSAGQGEAVTDEEAFVAEFETARKTIIKPTLVKLGEQVKPRGHSYALREGEFKRAYGSRPLPDEAFIRMQIYLSNEGPPEMGDDDRRAYIMFKTNFRTRKVEMIVSDLTATGGETQKEGEFMVNQFTPMFVQEKFVHLFRKLSKK